MRLKYIRLVNHARRIFWYVFKKKTLNILIAINKPKALSNKIKTTVLVGGMHSFIAPPPVSVNMQVVDRHWLISKYDDIHWCHWPMSICCVSFCTGYMHCSAIFPANSSHYFLYNPNLMHQVCFQTKVKETDGSVRVLWATVLENDQWIAVCKLYQWPVLVWSPWWGNWDIFSVDADTDHSGIQQRPCY